MGTTYLELTNKVLRKLNEVELTSANFSSATGFHALAKDLVQEAIDKINQAAMRWPFNHTEGTITCVADTNEYAIPTGYKVVDWDTMFLQEDNVLQVSSKTLPMISYKEWHNTKRGSEALATAGSINLPERVYRTRNDKIGITPIPDRAYTITFEYWQTPPRLTNHDDTTLVPEEYDHIITSYAMIGGYRFRENFEMAGVEYSTFKEALKDMKKVLIPDDLDYSYDTRVKRSLNPGWPK